VEVFCRESEESSPASGAEQHADDSGNRASVELYALGPQAAYDANAAFKVENHGESADGQDPFAVS
jgi:hypothetical protein